ncbi:hypothetical protein CCMSSC00406_0006127 [Pleurotus cornucopiae]|uniref:Uncharacterized protein n=1 Tax=Pleurotus cornucopiae TaxID=5321 RepID=A0ACB7JB75_PLECO|nr:hypothetical protein CCMSSC00406_0006127 [Pleurotus cornucopiae]
MKWVKIPLTCSEVMDIISHFPLADYGPGTTLAGWKDEIRPYVVAAMAKNPVIEGDEAHFISTLNDELQAYDSMPRDHMHLPPRISVHPILLSVCDLINAKRTQQTAIPSHLVHEQIALLGQYAILTHRWCPDGQELSFTDVQVTNFSVPNVQAKEGFRKLTGFTEVVQSTIDAVIFGWIVRALVNLTGLRQFPLCSVGIVMPMFRMNPSRNRIICFTKDWRPVGGETGKFHADRGNNFKKSSVYNELVKVTGNMDWHTYIPEVHQIFDLLQAMRTRETTIPESDMVYSLLSALNIDIPVEYDEGFDWAFYRLQVKYLTHTNLHGGHTMLVEEL